MASGRRRRPPLARARGYRHHRHARSPPIGCAQPAVQGSGPASRLQRRDAVRAPIGLEVIVAWDQTVLRGSTVDLSENGLMCVFRPNGDLGVGVPYPRRGAVLSVRLNLYSDELATNALLVRRVSRKDQLLEWSLQFVDLPESSADLIRSHVFTALRNARARGLTKLY
ncbi:PilZ domain-containing protein [Modestobacter sp. NPDC013298]|uniref:PilZ domain-containing protein n=1 Tax=Modestobacter sp. NPDC013298 TaxID=3155464 RepID=UPI00340A2D1F